MYSAKAIANWFLDKGDEEISLITPLRLNKLVYVAHGWHLGITDYPLIKDEVEAWDYGPVIPDIYHEFKQFRSNPITSRAMVWDLPKPPFRIEASIENEGVEGKVDMKLFLDRIWNVYENYSAVELANLTHEEGTPWFQTYYHSTSRIINNAVICRYYRSRRSSYGK